jgi:hypothetical protein
MNDEMIWCGDGIQRPASQLRKPHREAYPEQYEHPACGTRRTKPTGEMGTVRRVMPSRFGSMAEFEEDVGNNVFYRLADCPEAP